MSGAERTVLILGGTGEAFELAEAIEAASGWHPLTSMAGRTRNPRTPAGEVIFGGFGGAAGLRDCLNERRFVNRHGRSGSAPNRADLAIENPTY